MLAVRVLFCIFISHVTEASLTIGAFNIQRLSDGKTDDPAVVREIAQILIRYDVATIEEVLHTDAMHKVMVEINRLGGPYSLTLSEQLGRSSYREYLAIIYRSDKVTLMKTAQYPDTEDAFEREPFSALFHTIESRVTSFGLMGVHLKPEDVRSEIDALVKAYEDASRHFRIKSFVIAGDFNADCRYLSNRAYHNTAMWSDPRFEFLMDNDGDSTTNHNTNCAYDRFVATGLVRSHVVSGSIKVYNFEADMHLTYDQALDISDHYPIQMQLE